MRFLFPLALLMSTLSYGQVSTPRNPKVAKAHSSAQPQIKNSSTSAVDFNTVAECDSMILSIDRRVESRRSNPSENTKATESGWFERMESLKMSFIARKEELLKTGNN